MLQRCVEICRGADQDVWLRQLKDQPPTAFFKENGEGHHNTVGK